jgi:transcriptional regulator with XRE-family HTH domain
MSEVTLTIGHYRHLAGLKIEQLADKLGCSKGYASDLCSGKEPVSQRMARKMEGLTGIPWHKWMEPPAKETAA